MNGLVIVQSLHDNREVLRALTNSAGNIPGVDLQPGIYRVITCFPYSLWKTKVREFLVTNEPLKVALTMDAGGTTDNVVFIGRPTQVVQVLDRSGKPIVGALVIARDSTANADMERRYNTNQLGEVRVQLISNPTVIVVVRPPDIVERVVSTSDMLPRMTINMP